jgi:phosphoribosylaminoimidazolecarboxamide formyltransferase/IMP cyclohydrolase
MKKKALLSVYDKKGILELAQFLVENDWDILSTGGTASHLRASGIAVWDVAELTGFPELLDGRVKTLHPAVHAGILARRDKRAHAEALAGLGLGTIDLVCVNLYPFFEKAREGLSEDETIEFIDIGGPALLRSAAKNCRDVIALSSPSDYQATMEALKGGIGQEFRRRLASRAFELTAAYDAAVSDYLRAASQADEEFPEYWTEAGQKAFPLRYGENGHQKAALYYHPARGGALPAMEFLGGKELSYNNIRDVDLAWKAACAFGLPADGTLPLGRADSARILPDVSFVQSACCVAVKHNTPCGMALGATLEEAYSKTYLCDPVSIFGGIVACNVTLNAAVAKRLDKLYLEIVIAPDYEPEALETLRQKKDLRIIRAPQAPKNRLETVSVDGGLLVQEANRQMLDKWDVATRLSPDPRFIPDLLFGLRAVNWVKSNAIVIVKDRAAVGLGGGETNRIWAAELALNRAAKTVCAVAERGAKREAAGKIVETALTKAFTDAEPARVLASDAFFPFPDVVEAAAAAGIKAIIQSGGSNNDKASIEACDDLGVAMVFTGTRHFKH